jgi:hypothetical protein
MRSQKQSNRSPRPFKNKQNDLGWSGGNRNDAYVPPAKGSVRVKKPGIAVPDPETPPTAEA